LAAEPVLTVSDLHAGYGDLEILRGIDLSIVPGVTPAGPVQLPAHAGS
jgi:ABC-type histidine transport system ATPase subunit